MYGRDLERFFAEIDAQHMHDARDEVEAVLDALYEPTDGMVDAINSHGTWPDGPPSRLVWQAMIDHIRSEGKE